MSGLFKRIGVTAAIAVGGYFVSALVCASHLMRGAEADTELRRSGDALSGETDQS